MHGLLYVALIAMPLAGWLMATAYGAAPHLGRLSLPMPWIPHNAALAGFFATVHSMLAIAILGLAGLHSAGALKHYLIDNDGVMQKMLPHYLIPLRPARRKRT
jgi:cytochrome b561